MLIEIHLGCRWSEQPTVIRTIAPARYAEFNPDDIFDAMQRIGHPVDPHADHEEYDIERIERKHEADPYWGMSLKYARRALDRRNAPSMSVGDRIIVSTNPNEAGERTPIVEYVCESMGWTTKAPAPVA
jgi:hypothetical protein